MRLRKRFWEWIKVKSDMHISGRLPHIKEGEIWWCAMGENVGVEINGKNAVFSRSVLVFKKLSRYGFMGIPLTSQQHSGSWYAKFKFQGKEQIAVLSQARTISVSRLYSKMGDIDDQDKIIVRNAFKALYFPEDAE